MFNNNYFSISTTHFSLPFHKISIEFRYIFFIIPEHLKTLISSISFCRAFTNRFCVFVEFSCSILFSWDWKVWKVKHKDIFCTTYNNVFVNKSINCLLSLIFVLLLYSSQNLFFSLQLQFPLPLSLFDSSVFSWIVILRRQQELLIFSSSSLPCRCVMMTTSWFSFMAGTFGINNSILGP